MAVSLNTTLLCPISPPTLNAPPSGVLDYRQSIVNPLVLCVLFSRLNLCNHFNLNIILPQRQPRHPENRPQWLMIRAPFLHVLPHRLHMHRVSVRIVHADVVAGDLVDVTEPTAAAVAKETVDCMEVHQ